MAVCASGVAVYAVSRDEPTGGPTTAPSTGPTVRPSPPAPLPTVAASPAPSGAAPTDNPGLINPSASFQLAYQQQEFRAQPSDTCYSDGAAYLDIDEPRADVDPDRIPWDFCIQQRLAGLQLLLGDGVTGSQADSPEVTPNECADLVRRAPIGVEPVVVQDDLVLCLITSLDASIAQGEPRRIALVYVRTVSTDDTVNLLITAWNVPR
jgi:hypothetical protein